MDTITIAWLAGILEGEGSFRNMKGSPTIQVSMTDRDVIERIASIVGVRPSAEGLRPKGVTVSGQPYKPVFRCVVHGTRAVQWMLTLYTFMGERRRAAIAECMAEWTASPRVPRASRGQRFMAMCHPDRVRTGQGLCQACYMLKWRANRKGVTVPDQIQLKRKLAVRAPKGTRYMSTCHPDRVRFAYGMCKLCYMRDYNNKRKLLAQ